MTAAAIIHFNKPKVTQECIESLLTDGWAPVLVWDNSDDEGTSLEILQQVFSGETRVNWARSQANIGFARGMNAALASLGKLGYHGPVLLLNNDARVRPGLRSKLMDDRLTSATRPTLVAPRIAQNGQEQGWLYYQRWFALVTLRPFFGSFPYLSGCCLLVVRENNAQPLFDEDFFMYGEDVELSWRMRREGGELVLLADAWVEHIGSASTGQSSAAYERFLIESHTLLARKLASATNIQKLLFATRFPTLLARALLRAVRYRSLIPVYAFVRCFSFWKPR